MSGFFGDPDGPALYMTDRYDSYSFAPGGLQPHPRIRELAEQEAEKHAQELIEEEKRGIGFRLAATGQYEKAVGFFTDAIKHHPKEFRLFGNRSLCYERMQQYEKALRDADLALSLEPGWIKGLFRKGKALCGLKRYYQASLVYLEVMDLDGSSVEARQELKRAQTLHLMEMGFSWAESSKALETHTTMEKAIEWLFDEERDAGAENTEQAAEQEDDGSEREEWITQRSGRPRAQRTGEPVNPSRFASLSGPRSGNAVKPKLFPVWAGVLAPSVTYAMLHQLFSRAGTVYSIKMLLEQQCAFVNYTKEEACVRAVQGFNGMVVEGAPLTVRYPSPTGVTDPCAAPLILDCLLACRPGTALVITVNHRSDASARTAVCTQRQIFLLAAPPTPLRPLCTHLHLPLFLTTRFGQTA
ncbi:unnamed protein product [Tetraodon nigroviridis]|uniref:(spotted green pufferfish) hypothetical protein n=1 Tax=Tetraodon nigroviridis TaxID=99883 RepID=Q4SDN6_TETNG|nr:unnamed protein product [Tetraodon nigroviridis]